MFYLKRMLEGCSNNTASACALNALANIVTRAELRGLTRAAHFHAARLSSSTIETPPFPDPLGSIIAGLDREHLRSHYSTPAELSLLGKALIRIHRTNPPRYCKDIIPLIVSHTTTASAFVECEKEVSQALHSSDRMGNISESTTEELRFLLERSSSPKERHAWFAVYGERDATELHNFDIILSKSKSPQDLSAWVKAAQQIKEIHAFLEYVEHYIYTNKTPEIHKAILAKAETPAQFIAWANAAKEIFKGEHLSDDITRECMTTIPHIIETVENPEAATAAGKKIIVEGKAREEAQIKAETQRRISPPRNRIKENLQDYGLLITRTETEKAVRDKEFFHFLGYKEDRQGQIYAYILLHRNFFHRKIAITIESTETQITPRDANTSTLDENLDVLQSFTLHITFEQRANLCQVIGNRLTSLTDLRGRINTYNSFSLQVHKQKGDNFQAIEQLHQFLAKLIHLGIDLFTLAKILPIGNTINIEQDTFHRSFNLNQLVFDRNYTPEVATAVKRFTGISLSPRA